MTMEEEAEEVWGTAKVSTTTLAQTLLGGSDDQRAALHMRLLDLSRRTGLEQYRYEPRFSRFRRRRRHRADVGPPPEAATPCSSSSMPPPSRATASLSKGAGGTNGGDCSPCVSLHQPADALPAIAEVAAATEGHLERSLEQHFPERDASWRTSPDRSHLSEHCRPSHPYPSSSTFSTFYHPFWTCALPAQEGERPDALAPSHTYPSYYSQQQHQIVIPSSYPQPPSEQPFHHNNNLQHPGAIILPAEDAHPLKNYARSCQNGQSDQRCLSHHHLPVSYWSTRALLWAPSSSLDGAANSAQHAAYAVADVRDCASGVAALTMGAAESYHHRLSIDNAYHPPSEWRTTVTSSRPCSLPSLGCRCAVESPERPNEPELLRSIIRLDEDRHPPPLRKCNKRPRLERQSFNTPNCVLTEDKVREKEGPSLNFSVFFNSEFKEGEEWWPL